MRKLAVCVIALALAFTGRAFAEVSDQGLTHGQGPEHRNIPVKHAKPAQPGKSNSGENQIKGLPRALTVVKSDNAQEHIRAAMEAKGERRTEDGEMDDSPLKPVKPEKPAKPEKPEKPVKPEDRKPHEPKAPEAPAAPAPAPAPAN